VKTRNGLPKHCTPQRDASGKRRVRFRSTTFTTYLTGIPWSEPFMRQYAAALEGKRVVEWDSQPASLVPGSIDTLIESYYRIVGPTLSPSTLATRKGILERFRKEHSGKPVRLLKRQHVAEIIAAKANTPDAANNLRKILRHVMEHAITLGMVEHNPVVGTKKLKTSGEGWHPWSEDEAAQFEARHPSGSRAHLALMLMLYTGQRRADVVKLGWQHVRGDKIAVRQEKTDALLLIPIAPELKRVLALVPRTNMTFLITARGAPFTKAGFGNWMRDRCDEAGLPQCSSHGLRKLTATRLAEAGCTPHEIAAILGHRSLAMVAHYTRAAAQARLAEQAMAKLSKRAKR
jgi:integrase